LNAARDIANFSVFIIFSCGCHGCKIVPLQVYQLYIYYNTSWYICWNAFKHIVTVFPFVCDLSINRSTFMYIVYIYIFSPPRRDIIYNSYSYCHILYYNNIFKWESGVLFNFQYLSYYYYCYHYYYLLQELCCLHIHTYNIYRIVVRSILCCKLITDRYLRFLWNIHNIILS
jgi:hypothetical protein